MMAHGLKVGLKWSNLMLEIRNIEIRIINSFEITESIGLGIRGLKLNPR